MEVKVVRLCPDRDAINFVFTVLLSEHVYKWIGREENTLADIVRLIDMWRCDLYYFWMPSFDGQPMGLLHGNKYNEDDFIGHIAFLRNFPSEAIDKAYLLVENECYQDTGCDTVFSWVRRENIAVRKFLKRNGFTAGENKDGLIQFFKGIS